MRKSEPGNSIYLEIGVWYDEAKDSIHIALACPRLVVQRLS